jgi:Anti-sigma-K factor rskA, C-terminal
VEHEALVELVAALALDALEPEDAERVAEHVCRCDACRAELASLRAATAALAHGVDAPLPPPGLRERILRAARAEAARDAPARARRPRRAFLAVAAATLAAVAASATLALHTTRAHEPRAPAGTAHATLARGAGGDVLLVDALPAAPRGMTYAAWITGGDRTVAAGTFAGGAPAVVRLAAAVPPGGAVAVTLERSPPGPSPAGPAVLVVRA